MKKKFIGKLVCLSVISLALLLSGCIDGVNVGGKTYIVNELEAAVTKTQAAASLRTTTTVSMEMDSYTQTVETVVAYEDNGGDINVYYKADTNGSVEEVYYQSGLMCYVYDGYVSSVGYGSYEGILGSSNDFMGIEDDAFDYTVKRQKRINTTVYTLTVNDEEFAELLDAELGAGADFTGTTFKIEISVDNNTGYATGIGIFFQMGTYGGNMSVSMNTVFKSGITIDYPQNVLDAFYNFYGNNNPNPDPDPQPNPEPEPTSESYTDTADGAVRYFDVGVYKKAVYDVKSGKVAVARRSSVDVYDAVTMTKEYSINSLLNVACLDADDGIMAVGYGNSYKFEIYNIADGSLIKSVNTAITVHELVMDGDMIIYADEDQWCGIAFYSMTSGNTDLKSWSVYRPKLTINRADHRLYVCETGISSSALMYFNSQTGEKLYESAFYQFSYNSERILFDGRYVHYYGQTFDCFSAAVVSASGLVRNYNKLSGFNPYMTRLSSVPLDFVSGTGGNAAEVAVYDNEAGEYIYRFPFYCNEIFFTGAGQYFLTGSAGKYVAFVDLTKVDGSLDGNIYEQQPSNEVKTSDDGKLTSFKAARSYTEAVQDDRYIYTLNSYSYEVNVYDKVSFETVKTFKFTLKPVSIDADGGRLAVGFGEGYQFWLYDTDDWSYKPVITSEPVYSLVLYEDRVIHAPVDQHCAIYNYNIKTETDGRLGDMLYISMYYVRMSVNREDGILYMCDRNSSSSDMLFYDLKTDKIIYESPFSTFSYNSGKITFDGTFVHYYGRVYDALNASSVSVTGQARAYKNCGGYSAITTIYDDGEISVFKAYKGGAAVTVLYDLKTDQIIYSFNADCVSAVRSGDVFNFLCEGNDMLYLLNLG